MIDKRLQIVEMLMQQGLMPLFYNADEQISIEVLQALYNSGVRIVEYTNRGPEALQNFTTLKLLATTKMPGLFLGIGTIKNKEQAEAYINAGADFLVSPAIPDHILEVANNANILWIPGCMTATEILKAESLGIKLVKLFPGNVLGPGFVAAIKDLFPAMKFMPTGGVDTNFENISQWFNAGVSAVGMGSKLINSEVIKAKNYTKITSDTQEVLQIISDIKAQS